MTGERLTYWSRKQDETVVCGGAEPQCTTWESEVFEFFLIGTTFQQDIEDVPSLTSRRFFKTDDQNVRSPHDLQTLFQVFFFITVAVDSSSVCPSTGIGHVGVSSSLLSQFVLVFELHHCIHLH
uniref:Uncharacterized protein n=1 Tax=Cacopsylla melanoneura TaxID=428564 RepID=A0A8D8PTW5_9HEMI